MVRHIDLFFPLTSICKKKYILAIFNPRKEEEK